MAGKRLGYKTGTVRIQSEMLSAKGADLFFNGDQTQIQHTNLPWLVTITSFAQALIGNADAAIKFCHIDNAATHPTVKPVFMSESIDGPAQCHTYACLVDPASTRCSTLYDKLNELFLQSRKIVPSTSRFRRSPCIDDYVPSSSKVREGRSEGGKERY